MTPNRRELRSWRPMTAALLASCTACQSGSSAGPRANADLSDLVLSQGELTPSIATAAASYRASVASSADSLTATPTTAVAGATVTIQGSVVASGAASAPIALAGGVNTFSVVVTAVDGSTQKTYTINVTRAATSASGGVASRTSGVAPLAVHFYAGYLDDPDMRTRFHEYDYTWDFGDPGSGVWGTTSKSRNSAKGAIAAHVFESPGVYTVQLFVRDHTSVVATESHTITVTDPDVFYSGTKTTCVSDTAHGDFAGVPAGARQVTTDDLSTITQYAAAGQRVLLHRGSSWNTSGLTWPNNEGPVTIGAYGTGTNPDSLGLYENAPRITVTGGTFLPLDRKQDWQIVDLHLVDPTRTYGSIGGDLEMRRLLFLRLEIEGFDVALGWSHWNTAQLMTIDDMVIASCELSDSNTNVLYVGSERLALLGNVARNARASHVVRVWQSYQGVISNNLFSGASLDNTNGRHALKHHGPGESELSPTDGNGSLLHRSEFGIVSDNVFGSSGPWPLNLAPQDSGSDERLSDIIFERNRYHQDYGSSSSTPLQIVLRVAARYVTVRNNVFDGAGQGNGFTGIAVLRDGVEPAPIGVALYNNTILRTGNTIGDERVGITIDAAATQTVVRNNLVSFPGATVPTTMLQDSSADLVADHNLMLGTPGFVDATNADPLLRDFRLQSGSSTVDAGVVVPVFDDLAGNSRPSGDGYDLGALER